MTAQSQRVQRAINHARKTQLHRELRKQDTAVIEAELARLPEFVHESSYGGQYEEHPFAADPSRLALAYVDGRMIYNDLFDPRPVPIHKKASRNVRGRQPGRGHPAVQRIINAGRRAKLRAFYKQAQALRLATQLTNALEA